MADTPHATATPRLLLYAMYDASVAGSGPRVRIGLLAAALARLTSLVRADHGRWRRLLEAPRNVWRLRRVDAVYVESPTGATMPWDLLVLAVARGMGRPVGVYFRDAYQLYRDLYPAGTRRQRLADVAWRLSIIGLRRVASVSFVPSAGLGKALGLRDAVVLPPGTDPAAPDLGAGDALVIGYVGATTAPDGFDRLLEAMSRVRDELPQATLRVVGGRRQDEVLPAWVELLSGTRDDLPRLLADVRACVIPRPINRYTDLARPIKLADYLSLGKPIVATSAAETVAYLRPTGAALLVDDHPAAIAEGLAAVLRDRDMADGLARAARALAVAAGNTWHDRAALIVERLTTGRRTAA
jgi:glycosyltransferase involved in cell wall biosynthesis